VAPASGRHLVNSIVKILLSKTVCAYGSATKHLTGLEAKTIHRLLENGSRIGALRRTEETPLECDLLVADETSMVNLPLMLALLRALPHRPRHRILGWQLERRCNTGRAMTPEPLDRDTVRVRWLRVEAGCQAVYLQRWRSMLDVEELVRANQFHFDTDRNTFTAAHGWCARC
jgi:AAA domain-containing protein